MFPTGAVGTVEQTAVTLLAIIGVVPSAWLHASSQAAAPAFVTALRADRMLDVETGKIVPHAGVVIEADRIRELCVPSWRTRGEESIVMLRAYAEAGMSPLQISQAATTNGAGLLGLSDQVGSIREGKFADIIGVGGIRQDLTVLERVCVCHEGRARVQADRDERKVARMAEARRASAEMLEVIRGRQPIASAK